MHEPENVGASLLQVAAAVFSFRGTRLNKSANLRADLQLMRDLDAELFVTQRATKKVAKHMKRLQEQSPDIQWGFFVTGEAHWIDIA